MRESRPLTRARVRRAAERPDTMLGWASLKARQTSESK
jgi:hypothetical protein